MTSMKTESDIWKELRKPFAKEAIGTLPKPYKRDSPKSKCNDCGGYHGLPAVHLDYIGHAAVTDRLNTVLGPNGWTWEPLAYNEIGLPQLDDQGNLWIKLRIKVDGLETTRLGYGDGSSSIKELIGDALRNAAMRFGVALDLWTKDELESTLNDPGLKNDKPSGRQAERVGANGYATEKQRAEIDRRLKLRDITTLEEQRRTIQGMGESLPLTVAAAGRVLDKLNGDDA